MKKEHDQPLIEKQSKSQRNKYDEKLVSYIDSEISYIQHEVQEPGWTVWAIAGSLATLIWLLMDVFQKQKFDLENALILLLGTNYLVQILRDIFSNENIILKRKRSAYLLF